MPWTARFRQWLDRWLGSGDDQAADASSVAAPPVTEAEPAPPLARLASAAEPVVAPVPRRRAARATRRSAGRVLGLALQGGGAHGAFTWGVLDRLLEDPDLTIPAITGASAGALNGAALVTGHARGGNAGARVALEELWDAIAEIGSWVAPFQAQQVRMAADFGWPEAGTLQDIMQAMARMWSPVQLNPLNVNPVRDLLVRLIDVEALHASPIELHVSATCIETGEPRIFTGRDLSVDALMASAALPFLYRAVEIDGRAYWDGGYSANPPLTPLFGPGHEAVANDVLLVQINPKNRPGIPATAGAIGHRVNEITFNGSLIAELRALSAMGRIADAEGVEVGPHPVRLHHIGFHDEVLDADPASAGSLDRAFHRELRDYGRGAAERWLASSGHELAAVGRAA